jgi:hypothetical protein
MNKNTKDITAPSGKVVQFVAKRGEIGVHMALADKGYDLRQLKNGVWASGKVAYKNESLSISHSREKDSKELYHHGILGQKWGVRRTPEQLAKLSECGIMNLQYFAKKTKSLKTVKVSKQEYAHVMSELVSNITDEQKTHTIIQKAIGNYMYSFENNFDDTYRLVKKKKIKDSITGLSERKNNS